MEDLTIAMIVMALLSIAIFFAVRAVFRKAPGVVLDGLAVILVLSVGVYVRLVWGQLWIVKWIPLSSVIVLSNWFPLILGALAGVLWVRAQSQSILRRLPVQILLLAGAIWSMVYVIPGKPPECEDSWIDARPTIPFRICRQTTPYTCSAAALATILGSVGIDTTEAEMASLCLTKEGTTWLGIYHGLTVRLRGSGYRAEFFECSRDELSKVTAEYAALLCCELSDEVDAREPMYRELNGWIPGIKHSTVLFGLVGDRYLIGDPSQFEPEIWTETDIDNLWTGSGLCLVKIDP